MLFGMTLPVGVFAATENTERNLMSAIQGETNASAAYSAFADVAEAEGYYEVANLFRATSDAEKKHSEDEWYALIDLDRSVTRPAVGELSVGTTAENLQAAIDGEIYEYTVMYPSFIEEARAEYASDAISVFNRAMKAEQIHAGNYADALENIQARNYMVDTYSTVYRCPVCGAVFSAATVPTSNCPVCGTATVRFVRYIATSVVDTYENLMTAVQGETNAVAAYTAYAEQAEDEGYLDVANLFLATAAAEQQHADELWVILTAMGAKPADRPKAAVPVVGSTAENLQAAIDGETYEYITMYPNFTTARGAGSRSADASRLFFQLSAVEAVHGINFEYALARLDDAEYLAEAFGTLYRCPVCGAVFSAGDTGTVVPLPGDNCSICRASVDDFLEHQVDEAEAEGVFSQRVKVIALTLLAAGMIIVSRGFGDSRRRS